MSAQKSCGLSNLATLASLVSLASVAKQNRLARPTRLTKVATIDRPQLFWKTRVAATKCKISLFLRLASKIDSNKN